MMLHWERCGRRPLVKICDFGYSRAGAAQLPCTSACGTPEYMAPEVWLASFPFFPFSSSPSRLLLSAVPHAVKIPFLPAIHPHIRIRHPLSFM